jgi:5-methylcytosine-specific restriction protein A
MTSNWDRYPSRTRRDRAPGWKQLRAKVMQRDEWTCQLRGPHCAVIATDVDHVVNVASGGSHDMSNLVAACTPCHRDKSQREAQAGRNRGKRRPLVHPSDVLSQPKTVSAQRKTPTP